MSDQPWDGGEDPEEIRVLHTALDSYFQYAKTAHFTVTHLRRQAFYALPENHWRMLAEPPFNFLEMLDRTDGAIDANAELARAIAHHGLRNFTSMEPRDEGVMPGEWAGAAKREDIDKARSTLRQFYRDWSAAGEAERSASYGPAMRALESEKARAKLTGRWPLKVLVPGAGLGRLVFDLAANGYHAEGNEISYHQLVASSYILNSTERAEQHTIYPWVHTFLNHRTRENHLRGYGIPDIHPATALGQAGERGEMSMCASDFLCHYNSEEYRDAFDAVATVFFLDTAPNLIRYLLVIFHCLKPGGVLVNVGPLHWHFENHAPQLDSDTHGHKNTNGIADPGSFELADDEVMALLEKLGFELESRETGLETPYIMDTESMMQSLFRSSAWVARKPGTHFKELV